MSPFYRSIKAALSRELAEYRSVVEINRDILEKNSLLGRQLVFWIKSAQYYIVQLEVWQKNEDMQRL